MLKTFLSFYFFAFIYILICVFSFSLFFTPKIAFSEETTGYLRVITDDTPFYTDKDANSALFYLPYTYYVKVLERGDLLTRIEYGEGGNAIDGFVPTNMLFYDGLKVSAPFPQIDVFTADTAVLYEDSGLTKAMQYIFRSRKLIYYGNAVSPQGDALYFVGYNNKLGYVKEEELLPFTVPYHPNELTFIIKEEPEENVTEQPKTENIFDLRIVIFAVLGLAGVVALFFAVSKKPKTSPAAGYYDENDYE